MNQDEIVDRWNRLNYEVMFTARRIAEDPDYARELGIIIEHRRDGERNGASPMETIIRAVARKLIPAGFEWDVMSAIGGHSYLVLKGYQEDMEPVP